MAKIHSILAPDHIKKNNNAHVEQKNWTQVRHLFGYDSPDNKALVDPMNELYANEWSMYNNFSDLTKNSLQKQK